MPTCPCDLDLLSKKGLKCVETCCPLLRILALRDGERETLKLLAGSSSKKG